MLNTLVFGDLPSFHVSVAGVWTVGSYSKRNKPSRHRSRYCGRNTCPKGCDITDNVVRWENQEQVVVMCLASHPGGRQANGRRGVPTLGLQQNCCRCDTETLQLILDEETMFLVCYNYRGTELGADNP
ncbi:hypothetical protein GCM10023325_20410 [Sphingomonas lutea]